MQTQLNNNHKNVVNENITGGGNKSIKVPFWIKLYLWTRGTCNHQGVGFPSKSEGHKDTATFDKQLNRSTRNF